MALRSDFKIKTSCPGQLPEHESADAPAERVALLVTHGMGQQVPFDTLSAVAQALMTEHGRNKGSDNPVPNARRVILTDAPGAPELSRVEVRFSGAGHHPVDLHIYESYWAPLTEGQISFLQTAAFLFSSAWSGLRMCVSCGYVAGRGAAFDRWLFGGFHRMRIKSGTFTMLVALLFALVVLLAPVFLIFTPWGAGVDNVAIAYYKRTTPVWPWWERAIVLAGVALFWLAAYWIRYFIVEFAGDVAIYVSSYKVSRFDAIRNAILDQAHKVGRQIYSAGIVDKHQPPYDRVIIVGHSLGSVISYELLNAAINWDEVENASLYRVVQRTSHLVTFGSPLDKTAFLFRNQVTSKRNLREALSTSQQPLILDYKAYRPKTFEWINIYSPMDIVSGRLEYYDVPDHKDCNRVNNMVDWRCWIPLVAHVQYWNKPLLHEELYAAVCGVAASAGATRRRGRKLSKEPAEVAQQMGTPRLDGRGLNEVTSQAAEKLDVSGFRGGARL
jgi:hypothetical protein